MHETEADLDRLQQLLDESFARSSPHLLSIMEPHRRLDARRLAADMPCPAVLNLATVTARGEPRLSAVDGHFLHGHWYFSTAADSPKTWHLLARPAVSASYTPADGYGVFCHGTAVPLEGADERELLEHMARTYGTEPEEWSGVACFRIDPNWVTAFALTDEERAQVEAHREGLNRDRDN